MKIKNIATEFNDSGGKYKVVYDIDIIDENRTITNIRPMSDMPFKVTQRIVAILITKILAWAEKYSITELQQLQEL